MSDTETNKTDIDKYILLWAQLLEMGEVCALEMIKKSQPTDNPTMILKKALDEQSRIHHQANIEVLRRLNK